MKKTLCMAVVLAAAAAAPLRAATEDDGWRLAVQAWTFRSLTLFETIDQVKALGLKYIEMYPKQTIGGGLEGQVLVDMPADKRDKIKQKLSQAGVKAVNFGVFNAGSEAEWRKAFEFAKALGIETIASEPAPEQLDFLEKLCGEFEINIAIHNHPEPSRYWNPDTTLAALKGRSLRLGACADTGHFLRSKLDPVECLKKLEGRIISLHLKDLNAPNTKDAHDVVWGTGTGNADGQMKELARQRFRGVISIEYEKNDPELAGNVKKCVDWFEAWSGMAPPAGPSVFADDVRKALRNAPKGASDLWDEAKLDPAGAALRSFEPIPFKDKIEVKASNDGFENEGPGNLFDKDATKWCLTFAPPAWVTVKLTDGKPQTVEAYTITSANDNPPRDVRSWKVFGSNDGQNWTELDSQIDQRFRSRYERKFYPIAKPAPFSAYKLEIVANAGDQKVQLAGWHLFKKTAK